VTLRRSIADARRDLPGLIREAEAGRPVEITRHGRPVAVLVGRRDLEALRESPPTFRNAYAEFVNRHAPDGVDLAIDERGEDADSSERSR